MTAELECLCQFEKKLNDLLEQDTYILRYYKIAKRLTIIVKSMALKKSVLFASSQITKTYLTKMSPNSL